MDFLRSILADDPEPETPRNDEESDTDPRPNQSPEHHEIEGDEDDDSNSKPNSPEDDGGGGDGGGLWSFGDLVKTLTTKSESVLETYRRDLKEFGTGLRKESSLFREVASRAVKELPSSIEVGTSAIDGVLKSTADIIAQGKEALLAPSDIDESDALERRTYSDHSGLDSRRYSRFEAQLNAIQSDTRTFCEDPDELTDYNNWKLGFVLGDMKDDIEKLVGDNGALEAIYAKIVPNEVDDGTFWYRYFYKVHKLKQQEDMRAKLVKRSLSVDDEEELSWDVVDDDDDDDEEEEEKQQQSPQEADQLRSDTSKTQELPKIEEKESPNDGSETESSKIVDQESPNDGLKTESSKIVDQEASVDKNTVDEPKPSGGNVSDEKIDSGKDGDVTKQPLLQEDEDLEWDEIEDLGNHDEKKDLGNHGDAAKKVDLVKRLSTAVDDDEDLSWDIEDDDDEAKKSGNK